MSDGEAEGELGEKRIYRNSLRAAVISACSWAIWERAAGASVRDRPDEELDEVDVRLEDLDRRGTRAFWMSIYMDM